MRLPGIQMAFEWFLSFLVAGVAAAVAGVTAWRFATRHRLRDGFWALGLGLWAFSEYAQGAAFLWGWTVPVYKLYYFSAIALTGFLGSGSVALIFRRNRAILGFLGYILAVSAIVAVAIALAPVDEAQLASPAVGGLALPSSVRIWSPFINVPGGVAFIGGAAYSFFRLRKSFALLITIGAAAPAVGGALARFGLPQVLPFSNFVGVVFLAAGIFLSLRPAESREPVPSPILAAGTAGSGEEKSDRGS
ncbi:MAG: hypothetical protein ACT4OI_06145 [Methanobacteriota archaeon]